VQDSSRRKEPKAESGKRSKAEKPGKAEKSERRKSEVAAEEDAVVADGEDAIVADGDDSAAFGAFWHELEVGLRGGAEARLSCVMGIAYDRSVCVPQRRRQFFMPAAGNGGGRAKGREQGDPGNV
jgi:hypothetical protein